MVVSHLPEHCAEWRHSICLRKRLPSAEAGSRSATEAADVQTTASTTRPTPSRIPTPLFCTYWTVVCLNFTVTTHNGLLPSAEKSHRSTASSFELAFVEFCSYVHRLTLKNSRADTARRREFTGACVTGRVCQRTTSLATITRSCRVQIDS
jgi:hypothetical protein